MSIPTMNAANKPVRSKAVRDLDAMRRQAKVRSRLRKAEGQPGSYQRILSDIARERGFESWDDAVRKAGA